MNRTTKSSNDAELERVEISAVARSRARKLESAANVLVMLAHEEGGSHHKEQMAVDLFELANKVIEKAKGLS